MPTETHMAFVALQDRGYLKHIVSQNVDGLHRKSGMLPENLTELHGNTNVELCTKCDKEYLRDFRVRNAQHVFDHKTGRKCEDPACKGDLIDTIINFKENLRDIDLDKGFGHGGEADLCIAMGSSLRVTPAANIPETTALKGGKLVLINLQKTPLDYLATLNIFAKCDDVMKLVMKKLSIEIPKWTLQRRFKAVLDFEKSAKGKPQLEIRGVDSNGSHYSLFTKVDFKPKNLPSGKIATKEPFTIDIDENEETVEVEMHF